MQAIPSLAAALIPHDTNLMSEITVLILHSGNPKFREVKGFAKGVCIKLSLPASNDSPCPITLDSDIKTLGLWGSVYLC